MLKALIFKTKMNHNQIWQKNLIKQIKVKKLNSDNYN